MAEHTFYRKPDWVFDEGIYRAMTETEKDVFEVYCRMADSDFESFPSLTGLRKMTGRWKNGIVAARKSLEARGTLKLVGYKKVPGRPLPVYRVVMIPEVRLDRTTRGTVL